jgi:hypothetical protein
MSDFTSLRAEFARLGGQGGDSHLPTNAETRLFAERCLAALEVAERERDRLKSAIRGSYFDAWWKERDRANALRDALADTINMPWHTRPDGVVEPTMEGQVIVERARTILRETA